MNQPAPWDTCEIGYYVRHFDESDRHTLGTCDAMPLGWIVAGVDTNRRRRDGHALLMFDVQGEPSDRDGVIVGRILERLGVL